jgi:hypothetical protein
VLNKLENIFLSNKYYPGNTGFSRTLPIFPSANFELSSCNFRKNFSPQKNSEYVCCQSEGRTNKCHKDRNLITNSHTSRTNSCENPEESTWKNLTSKRKSAGNSHIFNYYKYLGLSWAWWYMAVTWHLEAEAGGGSRIQASLSYTEKTLS